MTNLAMELPSYEQTSTQKRGVVIKPRLPDFEFDETLPRLHCGDIPVTSFYNVLGIFANVAEKMFIRSAKTMTGLMDNPNYDTELKSFITQEAYHSRVHERMNKAIKAKGYPVEELRGYFQSTMDDIVGSGGDRMMIASALAGEQLIGVLGDQLLENPEVLDDCDEKVKALLFWHSYEEVEHGAALYDAYHYILTDEAAAYKLRMWGAVYTVTAIAIMWAVGLSVFMEHEGKKQGLKLANWKRLKQYLFGADGVFQDSKSNMTAFLKRDFHPWNGRDAIQLLDDRKEHVKDEWIIELSEKSSVLSSARTDMRTDVTKGVSHFQEFGKYTRFLFRITRRSYAFRKEAKKNSFWRKEESVSNPV